MHTIEFAYNKTLIELRRTFAPNARWNADEKTWTMSTLEWNRFFKELDDQMISATVYKDGVPTHFGRDGDRADEHYYLCCPNEFSSDFPLRVAERAKTLDELNAKLMQMLPLDEALANWLANGGAMIAVANCRVGEGKCLPRRKIVSTAEFSVRTLRKGKFESSRRLAKDIERYADVVDVA